MSNFPSKGFNFLTGSVLGWQRCSPGFVSSLLEPEDNTSGPSVHIESYMIGDEIVSQQAHVSCLYVLLKGTAELCQFELGTLVGDEFRPNTISCLVILKEIWGFLE